MFIYDPIYNRNIRTLDFFFDILLSLFLTLLPFYVTDNQQLMEMASTRSIQDRNKSINDMGVMIKQVKIQ